MMEELFGHIVTLLQHCVVLQEWPLKKWLVISVPQATILYPSIKETSPIQQSRFRLYKMDGEWDAGVGPARLQLHRDGQP